MVQAGEAGSSRVKKATPNVHPATSQCMNPSGCCHGERVHNENKFDYWLRRPVLSGQHFEGTDQSLVLLLAGKEMC
jgi:hypothetical protein